MYLSLAVGCLCGTSDVVNFIIKHYSEIIIPLSLDQDGRSRSLEAVADGSGLHQPTRRQALPARVIPGTIGCFSRCERTTTLRRAASVLTTRQRVWSMLSQSSSHRRLRGVRRARKWWTTHSSAASVRKPADREMEMTGRVRGRGVCLLVRTAPHWDSYV